MSQFFKGTTGAPAIGNVIGPASSTDNAVVRFDGVTGKIIQNSVVIMDDVGNVDSQGTSVGATKSFLNQNNDNTAGSAAKSSLLVGGTSAGDAYNEWSIGASRAYSFGVDNDDSQTFKLTTDAAANVDPSTGTSLMDITSAGQISFPAATLTQYGVMLVGASGLLTSVGPVSSTGAVLVSNGVGSPPGFTTATYPLTTTINEILYSSAANTVTGLATANQAVLTTGATGIPVQTALAVDGQLIIGSTAGVPAAATITSGAGITVVNGSNSITISATGAFSWNEETGTSATMVVGNGYIANNVGLVTLTLPATASLGDTIQIVGKGAGLYKVAQNAGQTIHFINTDTTTGVGGSLTAIEQYAALELVCITANIEWAVLDSAGNFTVV
jgi:hypothetical protein